MKRFQFRKEGGCLSKVRQLLTGSKKSKYNKGMEIQTVMPPDLYEKYKDQYDKASRLRREEIRRLFKEGKSQKEIAEFFDIDISRVNRIINSKE